MSDDKNQWSPDYTEAVNKYSSIWLDLYNSAQEKNEFQFILTLLRIRGIEDPNKDAYENTVKMIDSITDSAKNLTDVNLKLNFYLWIYAHITEVSEHYETVMNMVNIVGGDSFNMRNFPRLANQRNREMTPNEKIIKIKERCDQLGLQDYSLPFKEALDKQLRNAIFHSDYSVYANSVFFKDEHDALLEYDHIKTQTTVNKAIAVQQVIKNGTQQFIESYTDAKIIKPDLNFGPNNMQAIIRKGTGIIGLHEVTDNYPCVVLGRFYPDELDKVNQGERVLG